MSKITRKTAQIFGSNAGFQQIAEFGSLAAASPSYSTDPAVIQSLSNWVEGWFAAILGGNSPAIEDMNAYCYVMAYQVAYLMQEGVAEWDSGTTYYSGSIVNDGTGKTYFSLVNSNLNNALTSQSYWLPTGGRYYPTMQTFTSGTGTYTPSYVFKCVPCNATAGATYTNNSITYTVSQTVSSSIQLVATGSGAPTATGTLTKASGTGDATIAFVAFTNPLYLEVEMCGGGGGGGSYSANGNSGNSSTFGSSFLTCTGGTGGILGGGGPAAGGTGTIVAPALGVAIAGGQGGSSTVNIEAAGWNGGGCGGTNPFGGSGGSASLTSTNGGNGATNTGAGGGGASTNGTDVIGGGGGGAGGYIRCYVYNPSSSYAYAIGTGGTGVSTGSSNTGGNGAAGIIIVREFYAN